MGPLRFGAARALIALVALAVATGIAAAVPLPEINSQVRGFESRSCCIGFVFFFLRRQEKRDGPLPQFSAPPDFSAPLLQTRSFPRTRVLLPRDGASCVFLQSMWASRRFAARGRGLKATV